MKHDAISVEYRRHATNVSSRGSEVETLRELLAYLGQERCKTNDPPRLGAIDRGMHRWTHRFWRSTVTWGIRSMLGGRFGEAAVAARVALRSLPLRLSGPRDR